MESIFVHGHAGKGQFRLDHQDNGQLRASRLIGFFDPLQRQELNYNLSWIVLPPMGDGFLRQAKWSELSRLVNLGTPSYEDVGITFLKKDSGHVTREL
jgi:hypothetical protein